MTLPLYVEIAEICNLACPAAESVSARTGGEFLCYASVMVLLQRGDALSTDRVCKPNDPARGGSCDRMWPSSNVLALGRTSSFKLNNKP